MGVRTSVSDQDLVLASAELSLANSLFALGFISAGPVDAHKIHIPQVGSGQACQSLYRSFSAFHAETIKCYAEVS